MPPEIWSSVGFGSASSAVDSILNVGEYAATSAIDHAFWKKRYGITRNDYLADREHQEQYNSPTNLMKLLSEAGLNPNLIYGKFGGVGSSGTSQAQQQQAQVSHGSKGTANIALSAAAMAQRQNYLVQMEGIQADANLANAQAELIRKQTGWYDQHIQSAINLNNATIEKYYSEAKLNADKSQVTLLEGALLEAQTQLTNGQIGLQEFLRQNIIAQTGMYTSQKEYYQDAAKLNQIDYELKSFTRDVNNAIRSAGGVDKIADNQLKTLAEEFKILQATASVEGNKVMQWIEAIAPVLVDLSQAGKNTSDAVLSWTKRYDDKNKRDSNTSALDSVVSTIGDNVSTEDMIKFLELLMKYGS